MHIRTPVQLFSAVVGVGLIPAIALGSVIGVSKKDYDPIPQPSASTGSYSDLGERPEPIVVPSKTTTGTQRRVEFVRPTQRHVKQRRKTPSKTPHATRTPSPKPSSKAVPTYSASPVTSLPPSNVPEPTPHQKISESAS